MTEHYYTEEQTSAFKPQKIKIAVTGREIELYTAGGVFSPRALDTGTKLLIESAILKRGWKVLDLGCGYGAVGVLIKIANPAMQVVMSDVNSRSTRLAKMNAELHKLDVEVKQSDGFASINEIFDTILLNPPQTAGKDVCFRLIEESLQHLSEGGLLQIVARSQKGGKSLSEKMNSVFGNVTDIAKKSGYRVYASQNRIKPS